ncbi:hypothetical protein C5C74_09490 [Rathayibacter sp. AY1E8]|nr:hypothetical protein C5C74_09490 [Rathayibacter sp. AY1E8]
MELMAWTQKPLADDAGRVLAAAAGLPLSMTDRDRLITAFDTVCSSEWTRVAIVLDPEHLENLRVVGQLYRQDSLASILEVADSVATAYEFPRIDAASLAVALAVTSSKGAAPRGEGMDSTVDVVAEAFGLGVLEKSSEILNHHLRRLEDRDFGNRGEGAELSITPLGVRRLRRAVTLHRVLIVIGFVVAVIGAVVSPHWWVWLFVPFVLVSARTPGGFDYLGIEAVPALAVPVRRPIRPVAALLAAVCGLPLIALILLVVEFVSNRISVVGERGQADQLRFQGPEVDSFGTYAPVIALLARTAEIFNIARRAAVLSLSWWSMVVAVASLNLLELSTASLVSFVLIVFFACRGWVILAVVSSIVCMLEFGDPPQTVAVALGIGIIAFLLRLHAERFPRARVPVTVRELGISGIPQRFRAARIHGAIAGGRSDAALDAIGRMREGEAHALDPLAAWALVEATRPSEARVVAARLDAAFSHLADLIDCRASRDLGDAEAAVRAVQRYAENGTIRRPNAVLHTEFVIASLQADIDRGTLDGTLEPVLSRIPLEVTAESLLQTATMLRLLSALIERSHPELSTISAGITMALVRIARKTNDGWYAPVSAARVLELEDLRCVTQITLAELRSRPTATAVDEVAAGSGASEFLFSFNRPLEAARTLTAAADVIADEPLFRRETLSLRIEALVALNAVRHSITDPAERRGWWRTFGSQVEKAMAAAAAGHEWRTLAELIETARLQSAAATDSTRGWADDSMAPFIRVHGRSAFENSTWYGARSTVAYDLESLAAAVAGEGAWWWSTWISGSTLYWTLLSPTAECSGGSVDLGDGLGDTLRRLRDALPMPYPDEDPLDRADRVRYGELGQGGRDLEHAFAKDLGRLIPDRLREALLRGEAPGLAVAPAAALATVPWASIDLGPGLRDLRLVECTRVVIAPPAATIASIFSAFPKQDASGDERAVRFALLDPGHDLSAARRLRTSIPQDAEVIGSADGPTLDVLSAALRRVPARSSAVFACHTSDSPDGAGAGAGLVLGPNEVLWASTLLEEPERFPMPEQVVALACGSADLDATDTGEWTTLGPALLRAGAARAVVTSYPVFDETPLDTALLDGIGHGMSVDVALRLSQLDLLERWRAGDRSSAPILWAGHMLMGTIAASAQQSPTSLSAERSVLVSESLVKMLDSAAALTFAHGGDAVTLADVQFELAMWGHVDHVTGLRRVGARALTRAAWLAEFLRSGQSLRRLGDEVAPSTVSFSDDALGLVEDAVALAELSRHGIVDVDHLLIAAMRRDDGFARMARVATGWRMTERETARAFLVEAKPNALIFIGRPPTRFLSLDALTTLYDRCGAIMPPLGSRSRPFWKDDAPSGERVAGQR